MTASSHAGGQGRRWGASPLGVRAARRLAALVALLPLLTAGGCSATADASAPATPEPQEQSLRHSPVPIGLRRVTGPGFGLGVPGSYEESLATYPDDVSVSQWSQPHPNGPLVTAITVVREGTPRLGVEEQGAQLERRLREGGARPTREGLTWPGARSAQILRWVEQPGGITEPRFVSQLMIGSERGTIYSVVAFGPASALESEGLPRLMSTFALEE